MIAKYPTAIIYSALLSIWLASVTGSKGLKKELSLRKKLLTGKVDTKKYGLIKSEGEELSFDNSEGSEFNKINRKFKRGKIKLRKSLIQPKVVPLKKIKRKQISSEQSIQLLSSPSVSSISVPKVEQEAVITKNETAAITKTEIKQPKTGGHGKRGILSSCLQAEDVNPGRDIGSFGCFQW